jgi:hypothetical protein
LRLVAGPGLCAGAVIWGRAGYRAAWLMLLSLVPASWWTALSLPCLGPGRVWHKVRFWSPPSLQQRSDGARPRQEVGFAGW